MNALTERLLTRDEGFRASAYQDHLGYWTIGIGKLIDARKGGGITLEEAKYLLRNEVEAKEKAMDATIPWWRALNETRQAVLLSMAYQLGVSGLLLFRNTLAAVKEGRFGDAADGMLASRWASQTPLRAHRLASAMRSGDSHDFQLDD